MDNQFSEESKSLSDDLRRYFAIFWQWGWLLVLVTILSGVTAFIINKRITPVYEASTTLLINEAPSNKSTDYASILTSERLATTYAEMLTKTPVVEAVKTQLGLSQDVRDLQKMIRVEPVRDTQLIDVRVDNTNPKQAADIANTLVTVFQSQTMALSTSRYAASKQSLEEQLNRIDEQIQQTSADINKLKDTPENQVERDRLSSALTQYRQTYSSLLQSYEQVRVAEAGSTSNVVQIEPAVVPERPVKPRTMTNTMLAGIFGLLATVGLILLVEALDDSIHGPEDINRVLGLPVLGLVIKHDSEDGKIIAIEEPRSPVTESFRSLRTNLQFASVDNPLKTLLVTSPSPSDGKTTIAANLGVIISQGGKRVALVDADMRRPRIHKVFNIPNRNGISHLFVLPKINLDGSLQKTVGENFYAITAGEIPPNPAELLGSEKMTEILNEIDKLVDLTIIDSPPIIAVTDSAVLAHRVDGVLIVVKPGTTKMAAARQAVEQLRRAGANLLGVVLNEVDFSRSRYSNYQYQGYYYSYIYRYDESGKRVKQKEKNKRKVIEN